MDGPSGNFDVGGITGSVHIDTSNLVPDMQAAGAAMTATASTATNLAGAANTASTALGATSSAAQSATASQASLNAAATAAAAAYASSASAVNTNTNAMNAATSAMASYATTTTQAYQAQAAAAQAAAARSSAAQQRAQQQASAAAARAAASQARAQQRAAQQQAAAQAAAARAQARSQQQQQAAANRAAAQAARQQAQQQAQAARSAAQAARSQQQAQAAAQRQATRAANQAARQQAQQQAQAGRAAAQAARQAAQQQSRAAAAAANQQRQAQQAATQAASANAHSLMKIGYLLDDLQYVGEMGLRPIINNLMQIHPLLGMAAIAFDQITKHGEELETVGRALEKFVISDEAPATAKVLMGAWHKLADVFGLANKNLKDVQINGMKLREILDVKGLAEGWDALTGGPQRRRQETVDEYMGKGTKSDVERGEAAAKTIEEYDDANGRGAAAGAMFKKRAEIDKSLQNATIERRNEEMSKIIDIIKRVEEGDRNAYESLKQYTSGTALGGKLAESTPEAEKARKEQEHENALDQQRSEALHRKSVAAEKKTVEEHAENLGKDLLPRAMAGEGFDTNSVKGLLEKSTGKEVDPEVAEAVLKKLIEKYEQSITERAEKMGGVDRNTARMDLVREQREKAEKSAEKADRDEHHEAPWEKRDRLDREKKARDATSKFSRAFGADLGRTMKSRDRKGESADDVDASLAEQLKDKMSRYKLDPEIEDKVVGDILKKAREDIEVKQEKKRRPMRSINVSDNMGAGASGFGGNSIGDQGGGMGSNSEAILGQILTAMTEMKGDMSTTAKSTESLSRTGVASSYA